MDLISSIFDDKRIQKNRLQGKPNTKSAPPGCRVRRTTKSNVSDKKTKTSRSVSQNDNVKHGSSKNEVRRSCSDNKEKQKSIHNNPVINQKSQRNSNEEVPKDDAQSISKEKNKSFNKEDIHVDPSVIRKFSKYFQDNDCIENSFESALEVYNDCTFDEKDEEFGRESFKSLDKDYFIEAYNKEGYELLQTSIQLSFDNPEFVLSDDESAGGVSGLDTNNKPVFVFDEDRDERVCLNPNNKAIFTSDDDTDEIYIEAYNSIGYELRQIQLQNQTEKVIKKELKQQDSIEEPHFEEKSIMELIKETHSPKFNNSSIKRTPSSSSKSSSLRRYNSTSSSGSYILGTGKYDESVDIDDDLSDFKVTFEVKTKADMIIQELLETEHNYIENLIKIKRDYIRYFKRINIDSKGMFGNILKILMETNSFYRSLQACGNDYEYIANTFKDYKHLFDFYPEYSKNKSSADLVVHGRFKPILQDRQRCLGDKLDLASYLLNPVQRLGRYILLLESLQKSVRKPECLDQAVKLVKQAMKKGNDYVAIDSIMGCDIDLSKKGSYIDREKFTLLKPKREEIVLFLFEQIVVFTLQRASTEKFVYKSSILLDDLQIINSEGDNQVFQLKNYTKSKKENQELHTYILEARNVKLRETWVQLIQNRLWEQLQQVKALSKTYKIPDVPDIKQTQPKVYASNSVKTKATNVQKRTSSDRNSVKRNSKFYIDETSGYDTL